MLMKGAEKDCMGSFWFLLLKMTCKGKSMRIGREFRDWSENYSMRRQINPSLLRSLEHRTVLTSEIHDDIVAEQQNSVNQKIHEIA
jgi:hypothetical protein